MKLHTFFSAAIATLLLGSSLVAQKPDKPETFPNESRITHDEKGSTANSQEPTKAIQEANWQTRQRLFMKCLEISNQEQVDLARYAGTRAGHEQVKEFATAMEAAHSKSLEQLRSLAEANKPKRTPEQPAAETNKMTAETDFVQLHQEIANQCLEDTKEYLNGKEDADFDRCFVGMQVARHASMHSALTVLTRHTKGKLLELVKAGLKENDKHLEIAQKLMVQLEADAASIAAKDSK